MAQTHRQQLFSWGRQREGQGGRPEDVEDQTWPRIVEQFPVKVKLIASGVDRSLIVTDDEHLWSFGRGWMGELGLAYKTQTSYPDRITKVGQLKWKQIACGAEHTLALTEDGEIWSWGANELGQLGQGHTKMVDRPSKVMSDQRWTCIAAGVSHSIALNGTPRDAWMLTFSEFGEVFTWGGKYSGQLGTSRPIDFTVPCKVEAENLPSFKFVTAGDYCSAAISISGDLYMWGSGAHGRLGLGTTISFDIPQHVPELEQVKMVSVTANHAIALTDTNRVFTWGANHNGELGNGLRQRQLRPIEIRTPETFSSVHAGYETSFGIGESGSLYVWGSCANGVLGVGRKVGDILVPTRVNTTVLFRGISVHRRHVLAICQGSGEAPPGWSKEAELIDPRIEEDRLKAEAKKAEAEAKVKANTDTEEAYLAQAAKRVAEQQEKLERTKVIVNKRQEEEEEAKKREQEEKQKKLLESARRAAIKKAEEEARQRGEEIPEILDGEDVKAEATTEASEPAEEDEETRKQREREERMKQRMKEREEREKEAEESAMQSEEKPTEVPVENEKEDTEKEERERREREERDEAERRELEELEREEREEREAEERKKAEEAKVDEEKSLSLDEDSGAGGDELDDEEAKLKAEEEELARLEAEEAELARLEAEEAELARLEAELEESG